MLIGLIPGTIGVDVAKGLGVRFSCAVMNGVSSRAVPNVELFSGVIPLGYSWMVASVLISFDGTSMNDTDVEVDGLHGVGVFKIPLDGGLLPAGPGADFGVSKSG